MYRYISCKTVGFLECLRFSLLIMLFHFGNKVFLQIQQVYIEDMKEEFVKEFIFPAVQANAIYEDRYLMGTGIT